VIENIRNAVTAPVHPGRIDRRDREHIITVRQIMSEAKETS
jgi:hypothetical protein